ncbi:hypothetical protein EW146_g2632 [Bondarzewia mesenterica]|uniref:Uncharacterized protein n=1 Tax=Bondarzewia mesenterica TaxID=1095465 RepID=A0A4V3XFP4_9AGAM|nr:hypothetical protein EW146_g2632 [Bondarzewia mesenterica]
MKLSPSDSPLVARRGTRLRRLQTPVLAVAFVFSLIVNLLAVCYQLRILNVPGFVKSYKYIGHDLPRELPMGKLRTVNMEFRDGTEHYGVHGMQAWAEWNAIRPPDGGYVYLGEAHFPLSVTMWHQLHCLNHLRTIFVNGDDGSEHTEHCFHYLRQGILCQADTTLEPRTSALPGVVPGQNVTHTCKDWSQVHAWATERHKSWTQEMKERMNEPSRLGEF